MAYVRFAFRAITIYSIEQEEFDNKNNHKYNKLANIWVDNMNNINFKKLMFL